jgi:hypothetical protein
MTHHLDREADFSLGLRAIGEAKFLTDMGDQFGDFGQGVYLTALFQDLLPIVPYLFDERNGMRAYFDAL